MPADSAAPADAVSRPRRTVLTCLGLVAAVWAIYGQSLGFEFVNFDDDAHITDNPHVVSGLTRENLVWDFGIHGPSQWHPLAWLSHQIDCAVYGVNPAGHHATNVLLHTFSALLLFLTLQKLTGMWGVAAFAAAAFAVHPLNVESVAWVSERRNVLCAVFSLLTINLYAEYVKRAAPLWYGACLLSHAAALMAKPLAMTIPCVLLLLDYWPLGRDRAASQPAVNGQASDPGNGAALRASSSWLVVEKVPLLFLSVVSGVLSVLCQEAVGTVAALDWIPLPVRLANAFIAYGWYLRKTAWPAGLAAFYPHPAVLDADPWPQLALPAALSAVGIIATTCCAVGFRRRFPWFLVGWFWYLGMLVPMIGIVQVGQQQQADRYAYLPLVGVFLIAGCTAERWARRSRLSARRVRMAASFILCGWGVAAYFQAATWRSSVDLFTHTLEVVPRNHWAHANLGHALMHRGRLQEAAAHFVEAIRISPTYALAHHNLGVALHEMGQREAGRVELETSIEYDPRDPQARERLGVVLMELRRESEALVQFREAVRLAPDDAQAHFNLGVALAKTGQPTQALDSLQRAIELKPDWPEAHATLRAVRNSLQPQPKSGDVE